MSQKLFYSYLHKQIPVIIILSVFPGLAYIALGWMHDIELKALIWYAGVLLVSLYGYVIYKQFIDNQLSNKQLLLWYKRLSLFYYAFFMLWLIIFLLFAFESEYQLHYIAIFTEIGAAVVASTLLVPDKKLYKPSVLLLMVPLAIYFFILGEWVGYILSIFSCVLTWVLIYAANSSHELLMKTNYQANHDFLTGLKNRYFFINYLQNMIGALKNTQSWSYLLLIDLDHFKTINDSLGHDIGDYLLQEVSKRIDNEKKPENLFARLGGDEFVVVGGEFNNKEHCLSEAELLAQSILSVLKKSYTIDLHDLYISASIGVGLINGMQSDVNRLIKEADIAMYEAKEGGRDGVIIFDSEMEKRVEYNLEVEQLLHFSLENDEIYLVFQPQLNENKKVVGAEVLARWENEKLGNIAPDVFIPAAEKTGSIIMLGHYIMESAFRTIQNWDDNGIEMKQFSINVSMRQFLYFDFVEDVKKLSIKYLTESTSKKIIFEITESLIAEDVDRVISIMADIKKLGIRFSMDDFGTGYSSLSYLKRLPIDEIKIDRSFVSDLSNEVNDQVMVNSVLDMAKHFNLSVVAEGIETADQFSYLQQHQCDIYQGYYFSKPLTEANFIAFYKSQLV